MFMLSFAAGSKFAQKEMMAKNWENEMKMAYGYSSGIVLSKSFPMNTNR